MSVYKYLPSIIIDENGKKINLLKFIFEEHTPRFSTPIIFNDPFEITPHIKKSVIPHLPFLAQGLNNTGQAHKFGEIIIYEIIKNIGILSLSKNYTDLTMWAHYADNHRGVVIEFDDKHPFFYPDSETTSFLHGLKKVQYSQKRLSVNSDEWLQEETFLIKSDNWAYEEEYRMTIVLDETENPNKHNIAFPPEIIKSILIGCRVDKETHKYVLSLKNCNIWKDLKIYECQTNEKEYKLDIKEIK
jgi:hypothetical protein